MGDLNAQVEAVKEASNAVVLAVEKVVTDVQDQTPQAVDPVWQTVQAALTSHGWTAPPTVTHIPVTEAPSTPTDVPVEAETPAEATTDTPAEA